MTGGDSFRGLCGSDRDKYKISKILQCRTNSGIYLVRCRCRHLLVSASFSSFLIRQRHFKRAVSIKLSIHDGKLTISGGPVMILKTSRGVS